MRPRKQIILIMLVGVTAGCIRSRHGPDTPTRKAIRRRKLSRVAQWSRVVATTVRAR